LVRSPEDAFPSFCHAVRELDNNRGREVCARNMCQRATAAFRSGKTEQRLCYAGLTNIAQPILIEGEPEPVAVIQFGAFLSEDGPTMDQRHRVADEALRGLNATPEQAEHVHKLLEAEMARWSGDDLERMRASIRELEAVIANYIGDAERQSRLRRDAEHDFQLQIIAAQAQAEYFRDYELEDKSPHLESVRELVGAIHAAATVMHNMTRGRFLPELHPDVMKVRPVTEYVMNAVYLFKAQARAKGIDIRLDLQSTTKIEGSPQHLQIAFNNLLQNSVKYSYRTTSTSDHRYIRVRGRSIDGGYEVIISNFGVGIERDELERIFEHGYRGRLVGKEYRTGGGQGLSLTKRIVDAHHGSIRVSSDRQGDSTLDGQRPYRTAFTVWFPQRQARYNDQRRRS